MHPLLPNRSQGGTSFRWCNAVQQSAAEFLTGDKQDDGNNPNRPIRYPAYPDPFVARSYTCSLLYFRIHTIWFGLVSRSRKCTSLVHSLLIGWIVRKVLLPSLRCLFYFEQPSLLKIVSTDDREERSMVSNSTHHRECNVEFPIIFITFISSFGAENECTVTICWNRFITMSKKRCFIFIATHCHVRI